PRASTYVVQRVYATGRPPSGGTMRGRPNRSRWTSSAAWSGVSKGSVTAGPLDAAGGGGEDVEQVPHLVRCEAEVCGDVAPHEITGTADEGGEEAGRAGGERDEGRGPLGAELGDLVGVVLVERGNDGVDRSEERRVGKEGRAGWSVSRGRA